MTRRRADLLPGLPARYSAECPKCGEWIEVGDRIVHLRGKYVHVRCAPGADDE